MDSRVETVGRLYELFNARDIDGVLAMLSADVAWANGMEGGYVHGHAGLRDYWTRQWAMVSPRLTPQHYEEADDTVVVTARQEIFDLQGAPLRDPDFGLTEKTVTHVFRFSDGMVVRFDIR